jgi:hypothetical protein
MLKQQRGENAETTLANSIAAMRARVAALEQPDWKRVDAERRSLLRAEVRASLPAARLAAARFEAAQSFVANADATSDHTAMSSTNAPPSRRRRRGGRDGSKGAKGAALGQDAHAQLRAEVRATEALLAQRGVEYPRRVRRRPSFDPIAADGAGASTSAPGTPATMAGKQSRLARHPAGATAAGGVTQQQQQQQGGLESATGGGSGGGWFDLFAAPSPALLAAAAAAPQRLHVPVDPALRHPRNATALDGAHRRMAERSRVASSAVGVIAAARAAAPSTSVIINAATRGVVGSTGGHAANHGSSGSGASLGIIRASSVDPSRPPRGAMGNVRHWAHGQDSAALRVTPEPPRAFHARLGGVGARTNLGW